MFHHIKDLQFNARVSKADPRFASLLLEQFGGVNGELKAAMQYFAQAFAVKQPYPDKYDLLMDIATEELSHLEIVGATIQMLLNGVNGELKDAADQSEIMEMMKGKTAKENLIHASVESQFALLSGGGPVLTNCQGVPWSGNYVNANGDLTVDLRSDIAAESRAKIVYEYLMQYTDDPYVKETLKFLMTREIAHMQMFEAALETIKPNFPPGVTQGDSRYSNVYFNMSKGEDFTGPWNEGKTTGLKETWQFVEDPISHVAETEGLIKQEAKGTDRTEESIEMKNTELGKIRSMEIREAIPKGANQWSSYKKEKAKKKE